MFGRDTDAALTFRHWHLDGLYSCTHTATHHPYAMQSASTSPLDPKLSTLLADHPVWRHMAPPLRAALVRRFVAQTFEQNELLLARATLSQRLGMVLEGTVRLCDAEERAELLIGPGGLFGYGATPTPWLSHWQAKAASDGCVVWMKPRELQAACKKNPALLYFFPSVVREHPQAIESKDEPNAAAGEALNLLATPIRNLIKRAPISLPPSTSIQAAATLMQDMKVSSVLLMEQGHLFGLITDRDLRNRVIAQGLDIQRPVADIATLAPLTVDAHSAAFETLLLMARHNIHHVPVMDGQRVAGMITATDLTEQHSTSAVYLAGDIYKQSHLEGLVQIASKVKRLQQNLAAADASAYSTGHIITAITDALTSRLIQLAELQLGPAPVDYVWVAAGSQARNEQTARSDQDNCLVLDDRYDEHAHASYFSALSKYVCDGLDACGYVHCPGEMMAMTDQWRQPRRVWAAYFRRWVEQPKPKALMLTCVFFDLRAIYGNTQLLTALREEVAQQTRANSLFLAHMVSNALKHRPPLGIFGQITVSKDSAHPNTIDLKHSGIVPIVDLARIYALAAGLTVANTHDRLAACSQAGEISEQSARDLRDTLEFLGKLRIAHQARQTTRGERPDNHLALDELSNFERSHLKEAFGVVQTLQSVLQQRYAGRF